MTCLCHIYALGALGLGAQCPSQLSTLALRANDCTRRCPWFDGPNWRDKKQSALREHIATHFGGDDNGTRDTMSSKLCLPTVRRELLMLERGERKTRVPYQGSPTLFLDKKDPKGTCLFAAALHLLPYQGQIEVPGAKIQA